MKAGTSVSKLLCHAIKLDDRIEEPRMVGEKEARLFLFPSLLSFKTIVVWVSSSALRQNSQKLSAGTFRANFLKRITRRAVYWGT